MDPSPPVAYIDAITERYARLGHAPYRWFRADEPPPLAAPSRPVARLRLGLLSTAGAYVAGQVAFHYRDDSSLRRIPVDTPTHRLRFAHVTENYLEAPRRDPGCVLPLTALRGLAAEGTLGALAPQALSCMGGIYSQRRVREELIPAVHEELVRQEVDAALLVPM